MKKDKKSTEGLSNYDYIGTVITDEKTQQAIYKSYENKEDDYSIGNSETSTVVQSFEKKVKGTDSPIASDDVRDIPELITIRVKLIND